MPEFIEPEFSTDVLPDGSKRYDVCDLCNYDRHDCPACGEPLSHNGLERYGSSGKWVMHGNCWE